MLNKKDEDKFMDGANKSDISYFNTSEFLELMTEIGSSLTIPNTIEGKQEHTCPHCKSNKTKDYSPYNDNGVMGPGYSSYKIINLYVCLDCGIVFVPLKDLRD